MKMKSQKHLFLSASGSWLGFRQLDNERGSRLHILTFPQHSGTGQQSPTVILWTFFMQMLVCLSQELSHPRRVFR